MSRTILLVLTSLTLVGLLHATDIEKYQPGAKPFHRPKSPQPVGVLTDCFGYHTTKWTPWNAACVEVPPPPAPQMLPTATAPTHQNNKAIILYERTPEKK